MQTFVLKFFFIYLLFNQTPVAKEQSMEFSGGEGACTQPTWGLGILVQATHQQGERREEEEKYVQLIRKTARCLDANDCRVVLAFLQRSPSFSLASASRVQHDNESWLTLPANVCTSQTPTTWTRTTVELVRGLMCSRKKKPISTTTLLVNRFWFFRSFFIKSRAVEFSRSLRQPQQSPMLAPQCLAFP